MHIINNSKFKEKIKIDGKIFDCNLTNDIELSYIYGRTDLYFNGMYLSISNENLTYLMKNATFEKGKIKENCILIKNGTSPFILIEGTDEYNKIMERKEISNIKLKTGTEYIISGILRDMETNSSKRLEINSENNSLVYMGKFYKASLHIQSRTGPSYVSEGYVFFSIDEGKYYTASSRNIFLLNEVIMNHKEYSNRVNNRTIINDRLDFNFKNNDLTYLSRVFLKNFSGIESSALFLDMRNLKK